MTLAPDVKPDDVIVSREAPHLGELKVLNVYLDEGDEASPAGYVEIDVTCDSNADIWDTDALACSVGAQSAWWLANTPIRRYRLMYPVAADVPTAGHVREVREDRDAEG